MHVHRRSVNSKERLKLGVKAAKAASPVDITTATVKVALKIDGERPSAGDFQSATWETIDGLPYAVILIGPDTTLELDLTDEVYIPWIQVTSGSEVVEVRSFDDVVEVY